MWIEAASPERLDDSPLDLHVGCDEPDLAPFFAQHATFLGVETHEDFDAPLDGKLCRARLSSSLEVMLTVERTSQLAKRKRAAVKPLLDRSGGLLRSVLDYL